MAVDAVSEALIAPDNQVTYSTPWLVEKHGTDILLSSLHVTINEARLAARAITEQTGLPATACREHGVVCIRIPAESTHPVPAESGKRAFVDAGWTVAELPESRDYVLIVAIVVGLVCAAGVLLTDEPYSRWFLLFAVLCFVVHQWRESRHE